MTAQHEEVGEDAPKREGEEKADPNHHVTLLESLFRCSAGSDRKKGYSLTGKQKCIMDIRVEEDTLKKG